MLQLLGDNIPLKLKRKYNLIRKYANAMLRGILKGASYDTEMNDVAYTYSTATNETLYQMERERGVDILKYVKFIYSKFQVANQSN